MQAQFKETEFRFYASAAVELNRAIADGDHHLAYLAAEELRAIAQHSDWPALRLRCAAALAEHSLH